jgi:hypothetical protein
MSAASDLIRRAACRCGAVSLEARGAPIMAVACYCNDCQEAARRLEARPQSTRMRDPDGGASFVVYRKDRVRVSTGADLLESMKLKETSPTKRLVATCCNSAMYLGFDDKKHWVDVYRNRILDHPPPIQMRICTRFRAQGVEAPRDVPSYSGYSFGLIARLVRAGLAMRLGF